MNEVQIKEIEAMTVMSLAFTGPYEQTSDKLDELMSWLLRVGHPYSATPFGMFYDDPRQVAADDLRAEVCLPIEEECEPAEDVERKELPAVKMACVQYTGPYANIRSVYEELFNWLRENGHEYLEGEPTREVILERPGDREDPEECTVEIQVPIA